MVLAMQSALVGLLCLGALLAVADERSGASWQTYVDATYKVALRSPTELMPIPGLGAAVSGPKYNHRAFGLSASGGENSTAEQLCRGEADHHLRPFGTNPTIKTLTVDGQTACLIWPSPDQHTITGDDEAELIVKYPKPVEIGGYSYSFMTLNAETKYIMALARSIQFLAPDPQNAPLLMGIAFDDDEASSRAFKVGLPINVTLTLENNSGHEIRVPFSDPVTYYNVVVARLGDRRVPFT